MGLFIMVLLLSACSKDLSIDGMWDVVDNKGSAGTVDFKKNGTYILSSGVFKIGGNYSFEDGKLRLTYSDKAPKNYEVTVENDKSIKLLLIDKETDKKMDEEILNLTRP